MFPQPASLTEISMGFMRSRVLCAAARLGVADALGCEQRSVEQLASATASAPDHLYRLLRALASFGVVAETEPQRFVLTDFGTPLRKDVPNSQWASIVFWADLLADNWCQLTECIRTGHTAATIMQREGLATRWSKDPNANAIFGAVMGTAPAQNYMPIAKAWDFSPFTTIAEATFNSGKSQT